MELVSSQSAADIRKAQVEQDLVALLRAHAANLLRVVRGAGKAYDLGSGMVECIAAFERFREEHGHYPSDYLISSALDPNKAGGRQRPWEMDITDEVRERWEADGSFDREYATERIVRGALQRTASMLTQQPLQRERGKSEMSEGIRMHEAAVKKMREFHNPPRRSTKGRK